MLTREEEQRLFLFLFLEATDGALVRDISRDPKFYVQAVRWLAERLKEINDECSQVHQELQKANEELARVYKVYGP